MREKIIELAGREETARAVLRGLVRDLIRGGWQVVADYSTLTASGREGCIEVRATHGAGSRYLTRLIENEGDLDDIVRSAQSTAQPVRIRAFTIRPTDADLGSWTPDELFESSILDSESNGTVLTAKTINDFTAVSIRYAADVRDLIDGTA